MYKYGQKQNVKGYVSAAVSQGCKAMCQKPLYLSKSLRLENLTKHYLR